MKKFCIASGSPDIFFVIKCLSNYVNNALDHKNYVFYKYLSIVFPALIIY